MKIEVTSKDEKLGFFQDLYDDALSVASESFEQMEKNQKQYEGTNEIDPLPGSQETPANAEMVRNITYELIESQVTSYIPNPSVSPKVQSMRNERNAKSIETLLRSLRDEISFEELNDKDERFNPIFGGSVWLVEWDESIITHNTVGDVKLSCLQPRDFVGQPYIYEVTDMEYCFIKFETTVEEIVRKYGVSIEVARDTDSEDGYDEKTATLIACFYKNDDDKVCEFVWSGDTILLDLENYYSRKNKVCRICGKRKGLCHCKEPKYEYEDEEYETLDHDISLSDGSVLPAQSTIIKDGQVVTEPQMRQAVNPDGSVALDPELYAEGVSLPLMKEVQVPKMQPTKLPYYTPNLLPIVIRKNISKDKCVFGQSDCEAIRPQQQAINKLETRMMQKLMRSGVYAIVPEDYDETTLDNSVLEKVFKARQGNQTLFGRIDLQVDISRDITLADRYYDQAKRILGITDSYQGQYDASAQSGKAKQIQVNQAAGRLDSKRQMKNAAYAKIDQIIFQYYLAYADEPRPAAYKDAQGNMQNIYFNRYDFIERDEAGEYYYNDQFRFSADASVDVESQRETLWQENRLNYEKGAYGPANSLQTQLIFWQNMEKAHYPWAHDNVERIREEIARQAEMQQKDATIRAQSQQIESLAGDIANREKYEEQLKNMLSAKTGGNKVNG